MRATMDLQLPVHLGEAYKSGSQKARVITEGWAAENLYCGACTGSSLEPTRPGQKVVDFTCSQCEERYQLKSQARPIGVRVHDSAYGPMAKAVLDGSVPNFCFLHYDGRAGMVRNLCLVPRFFLTMSSLEKLSPLKPTAQRPGWVGCNLLLGQLPSDARIGMVVEGTIVPPSRVEEQWSRFADLMGKTHEERGWLADVLAFVRSMPAAEFALRDFYVEAETGLAKLHPANRHVKDKIRQQLQVLRDRGVLRFIGGGRYRQLR